MSGQVTATVDTEGAPGGATTVPTSTTAGDTETSTFAPGGKTGSAPAPTPAGPTPDTEGASGGTATSSQMFPALTATPVTTVTNSGTPDVYPAYRAPSATPAAGTSDTTHTQDPTTDGLAPAVNPGTLMTATIDCSNIGAAPAPTGGVPAAPTGVTAAGGSRSATVSWTAVADPGTNNKIIDYVVLGSTGGTTFAPANATSVVVQNLVPGQAYTFQVAARSAAGFGPYSTASAAATPYDPDEADVNKPAGLNAYYASEPIYHSDGTIVPGSWGRPTAPTAVTCVTGGGAGLVTVNWTAPTSGAPSGGYSIALTDATTKVTVTHTTASGVTTSAYTGLTTGHNVTAVVTAIGQLASTASAASAPFTVP